jgi:hypothetical protein
VAIGVAALLALITASSVVDTIDRIPIVSNIIELIGIGVTGWWVSLSAACRPLPCSPHSTHSPLPCLLTLLCCWSGCAAGQCGSVSRGHKRQLVQLLAVLLARAWLVKAAALVLHSGPTLCLLARTFGVSV